ncbi:MAG: hypothetical protein HYX88_04045 [Chloroflexi bacterium]|nr:hypothetical protein [Chloroflexota bacterium]
MTNRTDDTPRARVFISCGQCNEKEKQLGLDAKRQLESRGFECYFAEAVHNLQGLTANIFSHLRNAEYAVFIDCQREDLKAEQFRGSVFVNQELAIAAFLETDSRVFHEKGVAREGVAKYLIANPIVFNNREDFQKKLREQTKDWRADWRNELTLELVDEPRRDVQINGLPGRPLSDWYHLRVTNRHINKYARNCVAYVAKVEQLGIEQATGTFRETVPDFELIWAGTGRSERHILPKPAYAEIDAFYIIHGKDEILLHHSPSTSSEYGIPPLHKGSYELTYLVISENFEPVKKTFRLEFGGDYAHIRFYVYRGDLS